MLVLGLFPLCGIFENPIAQHNDEFGTNPSKLGLKADSIGVISTYFFNFIFSNE